MIVLYKIKQRTNLFSSPKIIYYFSWIWNIWLGNWQVLSFKCPDVSGLLVNLEHFILFVEFHKKQEKKCYLEDAENFVILYQYFGTDLFFKIHKIDCCLFNIQWKKTACIFTTRTNIRSNEMVSWRVDKHFYLEKYIIKQRDFLVFINVYNITLWANSRISDFHQKWPILIFPQTIITNHPLLRDSYESIDLYNIAL